MKALPSAALLSALLSNCCLANVTLPSIFSDHAVLQKSNRVPVWGKAEPGEAVAVSLDGITAETTAGKDGKWQASLDLHAAKSGPFELAVQGKNKIVLSDILVGEVWLCSGQSNMEWPVELSANAEREIASATDAQIRLFLAAKNAARQPSDDPQGRWVVGSPENVRHFSGVGYFFGRELRTRLKVPIGLIGSYWGGTPVEAWTPLSELHDPRDRQLIQRREVAFAPPDGDLIKQYNRSLADWDARIGRLLDDSAPPPKEWLDPAAPSNGWIDLALPGFVDAPIKFNSDGSYWLRKVVEIPEAATREAATLHLGAVDDFDFTWINDKLVGRTGRERPKFWQASRDYSLPSGTLRPGANVILIRVIDHGGTSHVDGPLRLQTASGFNLALDGTWQGRLETDLGLRPDAPVKRPQDAAGSLFDGMIAPIAPYALRGAIWFQGEANVNQAIQYRRLFPNMITAWRKAWDRGDFPFYYVQLTNFMPRQADPADSAWAELREAQFMTLSLPATGMACAIDLGEAGNIHAKNKQDVARRLSLIALAKDYGFTTSRDDSGPLYRRMTIEGSKIRIHFDEAKSGLVNRDADGPLKGFAIAGKDRKFVWADAVIDDDTVLVSSAAVPEPTAVRYGWADNPAVSLYNAEGLPASPFRTDDFPAITEAR